VSGGRFIAKTLNKYLTTSTEKITLGNAPRVFYFHNMKSTSYAFIGLVIGLILGSVVGFGELTFIKKSQREGIAAILVSVTAIIGGAIGAKLGYSVGRDEVKSDKLGLSKISDQAFKDGRFWVAVSKWVDPSTGAEHILRTGRSNIKVLVSDLDGEIIINHGLEGANKTNVFKCHNLAKTEVVRKFMNSGQWVQ